MGSNTIRHDLYQPVSGEDGWATEVNDNFASLDKRFRFNRIDVTSQSVTLDVYESAWVDTNAAGGAVTVTLPADGDSEDGDRVEVGIEDASNDTTVSANSGQSIIGTPTTLTSAGETLTLEYKASDSTWMLR